MKNRREEKDAGRKGREERRQEGEQTHERIFFLSFLEAGHGDSHTGMEPVISGEASDLVFGLYCFH